MNRYCQRCKKPREHRKIKDLNMAQKAVGYSIMVFCGGIVPLGNIEYECNHCGNKVEDD